MLHVSSVCSTIKEVFDGVEPALFFFLFFSLAHLLDLPEYLLPKRAVRWHAGVLLALVVFAWVLPLLGARLKQRTDRHEQVGLDLC